MLLEYAIKNGAFRLKNSIWPTNDLIKCFQGQIQDQFTNFFPPQNYITFLSYVFGEKSFSSYQHGKIKMAYPVYVFEFNNIKNIL